ncbi:GNAT family N-acetyltransferase [Actinopolymorpha sp. B11F2]|uniref:GNAT family N-acetyltransferase n=1 Tax=Actinopolymorpha sp. B11F2 TaxID=3160862 RepID=UPI0032E3FC73
MTTANPPDQLRIVPASEAASDDLQAVFSTGEGRQCQCQFFKLDNEEWRFSVGVEERTERLREQTSCGDTEARSTSGMVAYLEGEAVGWCAVGPRTAYPRLRRMRVPWAGRDESRTDDGVWAVTCFVVRRGYRGRGIGSALARASIDFARDRGARAVEGYPIVTQPGEEVGSAALYVGSRNLFATAGFREVSRPTSRRAVMRVELTPTGRTLIAATDSEPKWPLPAAPRTAT